MKPLPYPPPPPPLLHLLLSLVRTRKQKEEKEEEEEERARRKESCQSVVDSSATTHTEGSHGDRSTPRLLFCAAGWPPTPPTPPSRNSILTKVIGPSSLSIFHQTDWGGKQLLAPFVRPSRPHDLPVFGSSVGWRRSPDPLRRP